MRQWARQVRLHHVIDHRDLGRCSCLLLLGQGNGLLLRLLRLLRLLLSSLQLLRRLWRCGRI